jgi:hypothetical protein
MHLLKVVRRRSKPRGGAKKGAVTRLLRWLAGAAGALGGRRRRALGLSPPGKPMGGTDRCGVPSQARVESRPVRHARPSCEVPEMNCGVVAVCSRPPEGCLVVERLTPGIPAATARCLPSKQPATPVLASLTVASHQTQSKLPASGCESRPSGRPAAPVAGNEPGVQLFRDRFIMSKPAPQKGANILLTEGFAPRAAPNPPTLTTSLMDSTPTMALSSTFGLEGAAEERAVRSGLPLVGWLLAGPALRQPGPRSGHNCSVQTIPNTRSDQAPYRDAQQEGAAPTHHGDVPDVMLHHQLHRAHHAVRGGQRLDLCAVQGGRAVSGGFRVGCVKGWGQRWRPLPIGWAAY